MAERYRSDLEALTLGVAAIAAVRQGRLAGVTVRVPPDVPAPEFAAALQDRLSLAGMRQVDVAMVVEAGPIRMTAAEFER